MKRVITGLSLLLLLLCGANAQNISQYEYWTDDDYASRNVVNSSGGNVSLSISTEELSAGIHFLNFRAGRSDGVWGNYYRYLYYIPSLKAAEEGKLTLEYWLDDDLTARKTVEAGSGNISLAIDISTLSPGVHYFNCTPITSSGERGSSERYLFYVPLPQDQASVSAIKGYEYWLDDSYEAKTVKESAAEFTALAVSLEGLSSGVHYFNCRAYNERGEYGSPVRKMFYIPQTKVNGNASIASAEYWLDDDYTNKVSVSGSDVQQAFTIDISHLSSGVHYFNYRAADNEGNYGNIIRQMFYIAHTSEASAGEIAEYEYWIDDDIENKVTGTDSKKEYVFNIDIARLELGEHTFNFRGKDALGNWGETFSETFEITEYVPSLDERANLDVQEITVHQGESEQVAITMNNKDEIIMTEFYMELPEGLHIATDDDGYLDATLSDRADRTHTLEVEKGNDGLYHFLAYSNKNKPFVGTEGALINVSLTCDANVEAGTYQGKLRGILMSNTDKQAIEQADITFNIEVTDFVPGDLNNDGRINGMDIVEMVTLIMEKQYLRAADLYPVGNPDGVINGMDLVQEVELVMSQSAKNNAPSTSIGKIERMMLKNNGLGVSTLDIQSDRQFILAQMTVELSTGLTLNAISSDRNHTAIFKQTGENQYMVLCYSNQNYSFEANTNAIEFHCTGSGNIKVKDVLLIDTDKQECMGTDVLSGEVTGIEGIDIEQSTIGNPSIYDLQGRNIGNSNVNGQSSKLQKGVYIINKQKVTIK